MIKIHFTINGVPIDQDIIAHTNVQAVHFMEYQQRLRNEQRQQDIAVQEQQQWKTVTDNEWLEFVESLKNENTR